MKFVNIQISKKTKIAPELLIWCLSFVMPHEV